MGMKRSRRPLLLSRETLLRVTGMADADTARCPAKSGKQTCGANTDYTTCGLPTKEACVDDGRDYTLTGNWCC